VIGAKIGLPAQKLSVGTIRAKLSITSQSKTMSYNRREFLQQLGLGALQLGVISAIPASAWASSLSYGQLPRSSPESQGMSAKGILDFANAVEADHLNLHSLMILRQGKVVAEGWWAPYAPDLKHTLYSLSKSFTSTAIGLAVAEGKLKVDDKVVSFFPEDKPATISANLAAMRVKACRQAMIKTRPANCANRGVITG
jgi:CubicO group peptidase (beta-lactamase class C family)